MLWRRAIQAKSVQPAQTSPLSSCVSSRRTGQSSPALGLDVMNCVPSGGLPKISRVEGRSLMPASAASFDWSISLKNLMPLTAMSALMRMIASHIGTALLTRTMPSSLSARAAEQATATRIAKSSNEVVQFAKRSVIRRIMSVLLSFDCLWQAQEQNRSSCVRNEMQGCFDFDSPMLSRFVQCYRPYRFAVTGRRPLWAVCAGNYNLKVQHAGARDDIAFVSRR